MAYRIVMPVRFGDIDYAGVVYYPRFFEHFHLAFEEFFREALKIPYDHALGTDRIAFPTVNVETDFRRPLRFGDHMNIELTIVKLGEKSMTVQYRLFNEASGELCTVARITSACIDLDTFRAVPFPEKYRQAFLPHLAA